MKAFRVSIILALFASMWVSGSMGSLETARAQSDEPYFELTSVMVSCGDEVNVVEFAYSSYRNVSFTDLTVTNTSDGWTESRSVPRAGLGFVSFEKHPIDKIVFVFSLNGGSIYTVYANAGQCDVEGTVEKVEYTPPPILSVIDWTCDGSLTVSISPAPTATTTFTIYNQFPYDFEYQTVPANSDGVFTLQSSLEGIPYYVSASVDDGRYWSDVDYAMGECEVPVPIPDFPITISNLTLDCTTGETSFDYETDASRYMRIIYYHWSEEAQTGVKGSPLSGVVPAAGTISTGETELSMESLQFVGIWMGDDEDNLFGVASILVEDCTDNVVPTVTPTLPAVTAGPDGTPAPIGTSTPTEIPVAKGVMITLLLPEGVSLEGETWSLFAPIASQVAQPAYVTGVVGPGNTISLPDLIPGEYRLIIDSAIYGNFDIPIVISADTQELVVDARSWQIAVTPEPTFAMVPTTSPAAETPAPTQVADAPAGVSGLPETGTGSHAMRLPILVIAGALSLIAIAGIGSRRANLS